MNGEGNKDVNPVTNIQLLGQAYGTRNEVQHSQLDGSMNTYSVSGVINGFAGQILQLIGNASNVARVTHFDISLTASAAALCSVSLQRTSSNATGGGPSGFNTAKNDINNPNAQSSVEYFTSAPSTGIPVGSPLRSAELSIAATGNLALVQGWDFGTGPRQGILLRGLSDFFTVLLGTGAAGSTVGFNIEWTESPT